MVEALTGIQVVEMAGALQGPAAAGYLRDMGAEVTRVESPEGDGARYHRGAYNYTPQGTLGAQFVHSNKGKRTISIDVNSEQGREIVYKLVAGADVFLTNRLESSLERMGYGYDTLRAIKPDLIYAAVNGFGHLGPQADKRMVDGAGLARGGLIHVTGPRDGPPVLPGAVIADMAGAMQLALGIMTALFARERHGVAQKVNTSSYGAQIWLQAWEIQQAAHDGQRRSCATGQHHANLPGMYGVYGDLRRRGALPRLRHGPMSRGGPSATSAACPRSASTTAGTLATKRMGMAFDRRGPRWPRRSAPTWSAPSPRRRWRSGSNSSIPSPRSSTTASSTIRTCSTTRRRSPTATSRRSTSTWWGPTKVIGPTVVLSETPGSIKGPPPQLGQHTEEVLLELGYDWDAIVRINEQTRKALRRTYTDLGEEAPR